MTAPLNDLPVSPSLHQGLAPSPWILAWAEIIPAGGRVLDLACGSGRHAYWLASQGWSVLAVDRDAQALEALAGVAAVECRQLDLETSAWPLGGERFEGIVVTNYLHRPLWPHLLQALEPRGVLLYETFAQGNARFGRPSKPEFLLAPGELLRRVSDTLHVVAYEDRFVEFPKPAMVQRICAARVADSMGVWSKRQGA
jgi:SAM-dependent methyltransferase